MFTGIASITTNSFGINVDVIDTSVGFLSARIQCSLAGAGLFFPLFLEGFEKSLVGGEAAGHIVSSSGVGKDRSSFKSSDLQFPSLAQS